MQAHEFWLEARDYDAAIGVPLSVTQHVGQDLKGAAYSYIPGRLARFEHGRGGSLMPARALVGDNPIVLPSVSDLNIVIAQTNGQSITYRTIEKFQSFVAEKDLSIGAAIPPLPFQERYYRYAKLIALRGDGGMDAPTGMLHEFIVESIFPSQNVLVRLEYKGEPRAFALVTVFRRSSDGVTTQRLRTDRDGRVEVPIEVGAVHLLDAVVLERIEAPKENGPVYETHWAALTLSPEL